MLFVGLDVIGGYVTEINVTSPTGVRELDKQFGTEIAGLLMDAIEKRLADSAYERVCARDSAAASWQRGKALAPVNDRLTTTLFLAALFHGIVILGITFAAPEARPAARRRRSKCCSLTSEDTRAADNLDAQYLAQRNQQGSGTTDERVRPANPARRHSPLSRQASPTATATNIAKRSPGKQLDGNSSAAAANAARSNTAAATTIRRSRPKAPLALVADRTAPDRDQRHRRHPALARQAHRTARSRSSPTLASRSWRRTWMPGGARSSASARSISRRSRAASRPATRCWKSRSARDGTLGEALVKRSSGRKEIDQAALSILRLASPFDPFPAELRKQYHGTALRVRMAVPG